MKEMFQNMGKHKQNSFRHTCIRWIYFSSWQFWT